MPRLKEHMIRTAAVGWHIAYHWKNATEIDPNIIVQVLLLHDTGNIIKFNLEGFPDLLGDEAPRLQYWKDIQKSYIETYGNDEHKAIVQIAREIDIDTNVEDTLEALVANGIKATYDSDDWNRKICMYADLRCAPFSVVDVNTRFDDIIARYKGRDHELGDIEKTEAKRKVCLLLEEQLQQHVTIDLKGIAERDVQQYYDMLSHYTVGL